jgi:hypothetical protein
MNSRFNRRSILRGIVGGGAVGMGLPLLDLFLDGNGAALANGAPLPTRVGTFFWGLGLTPTQWEPTVVGKNYDIKKNLEFLKGGLDKKTSVFTGFTVKLDGRPSHPHWTGLAAILAGTAPAKINTFDRLPSFDTAIASTIGGTSRFRTLDATPYHATTTSYSSAGEDNFKMAADSPLALYTRIFGEGFTDPNSGEWKPDPRIMVKQSVLSTVKEQREALWREAGVVDRARLDQYYTSVRELEQRLENELKPPAKCESCVVPTAPEEIARKGDAPTVVKRNQDMVKLMAMALACNQTNVFNYVFTTATSEIYRPGDLPVYHGHTHEEPVDGKVGYQPISAELAQLSVNAYGELLKAMDDIKEGDGTLLDHSLVLGFSDTGWAKIHSIDNIPMLLSGGANGRHKAGQHIKVAADPVTRVSLTMQQLAGVPVGSFGVGSMQTSKPITEIMA